MAIMASQHFDVVITDIIMREWRPRFAAQVSRRSTRGRWSF